MPEIPQSFGGALAQGAGDVLGGAGSFIEGQATAAGDRSAAQGYAQEAQFYQEAAGIAGENLTIEQQNVKLQQYMNTRALRSTQASVRAATAANGLQLSGSEQDILRMNAIQGGIASALIGQQGAIQENTYRIQQTTLTGEAAQAQAASQAAKSAAGAAGIGGIFGAIGGIAKGAAAIFPFL